jgi:hypothetical protein
LEEGTEVFRPTQGKKISDLTFKILKPEDYDPDDEHWKFPPGIIVKCEKQNREGKEILIAVAKHGAS